MAKNNLSKIFLAIISSYNKDFGKFSILGGFLEYPFSHACSRHIAKPADQE